MDRRRRLTKPVPPVEAEPDLSTLHKRAVLRAVCWAWGEVRRRWPEVVDGGREEIISTKLCRILNDLGSDGSRCAPGMTEFETIQRGAKVEGTDGGVEYQPDLTFRPIVSVGVRNRGDWGWFVECKIVNGKSSVKRYCEKGVQRFVEGCYASRMPSAAMFAYVRDGSDPHGSLRPLLTGRYGDAKVAAPEPSNSLEVRSQHNRSGATPRCCPIELTHLWLEAELP